MITHESKDYQNDHIMKDFWRNNERIASLLNGIFFKGEAVIKPEDIEELDTEMATVLNEKSMVRRGDIIKKVTSFNPSVVVGVENQTTVDKTMPMRVEQYTMLKYLNLYDNNIFYPIINLVIYYGTSKWNNEWCSLSSIYNPPEEFDDFFNEVKLNLISAMEQDYTVFNHPEVEW